MMNCPFLLEQEGTDVDGVEPTQGRTALFLAAERGHVAPHTMSIDALKRAFDHKRYALFEL